MLSKGEVARDIYSVEVAEPSFRRTKIPSELAFEAAIRNKTSSPCSLEEFMDYLVCEETNAETLQFFNWFSDYVHRWSELPPQEKLLSPPWRPTSERDGRGGGSLVVRTHRRNGSARLDQILEILDESNTKHALDQISSERCRQMAPSPLDFSKPRGLSGTQNARPHTGRSESVRSQSSVDEQRRAKQPYREEVDRVVDLYLKQDAPRRLNISHVDLDDCLNNLKQTTHPSALVPAFTAAETYLKSRSYPSFIRKSQCNANQPRLTLIRFSAILLIILGLILNIVIIAQRLPKASHVATVLLWWPGFTMLIAAIQGLCVFLYSRNLRQLRPWERAQAGADIEAQGDDSDWSYKVDIQSPAKVAGQGPYSAGMDLMIGSGSRGGGLPAARKGSMQAFGGTNKMERQARMEAYKAKTSRQKVWDVKVKVGNTTVRMWQDRTVLVAVCCGGAVSAALTVASLFI